MDFNKIIENNKQNIKNIIRLITKYSEKGSLKSWVSTIAKNTSLDYLKSSCTRMFKNSDGDDYTLESIKDNKISPEDKIINLERQKQIIKAIESLKPKLKEVIMMTEIDGYSYEQCAQKLKCPLGTIKSRVFNAKKELSIKLQDLL